jgi:hypothetical protein
LRFVFDYTWHDKRALPAAMLSTKKKTVIRVMATKLHFIDNMFPASLNYFPLQGPDGAPALYVAILSKKVHSSCRGRGHPLTWALSKDGCGL